LLLLQESLEQVADVAAIAAIPVVPENVYPPLVNGMASPPVRSRQHQSLLEHEILVRPVRLELEPDDLRPLVAAAYFSSVGFNNSFRFRIISGSLPSATCQLRTPAMRGICAPLEPDLRLPPTPLQCRVRDFSSLRPFGPEPAADHQ